LRDDPFQVLVECSMYIVPKLNVKVSHLIRLLYLAEVVKTTIALVQEFGSGLRPNSQSISVLDEVRASLQQPQQQYPFNPASATTIRDFVTLILSNLDLPTARTSHFFEVVGDLVLARLLRAYLLPFFRKLTIFLYARFGVSPKFAVNTNISQDATEFDRLREYLHLPTIGELILSLQNSPVLSAVVTGWLHDLRDDPLQRRESTSSHVTLNHPAIFNLIELPQQLGLLMEESSRRVCCNCNSVPLDPALCLLCGAFVCHQSFCCMKDDKGECNRHRVGCGDEVGIYFLIKWCRILLLYGDYKGTNMPPPYLDSHGETDFQSNRGRPQYLYQGRYQELRRLWISQGIPVYIARKLEETFDNGGWETA